MQAGLAIRRDIAPVKSPLAVFQRSPTSNGIGRRLGGQGRKVAPAWGVLGSPGDSASAGRHNGSVGAATGEGPRMEFAFDFPHLFLFVTIPLVCHLIHFSALPLLFTLLVGDHHLQKRYIFVARPPVQPCYTIYPIDSVYCTCRRAPITYFSLSIQGTPPPHTECSERVLT